MAVCAYCKKPINSIESKKAVAQKNEKGQLTGMLHFKCHHVVSKHMIKDDAGKLVPKRYRENSPTAYEMSQGYRNRTDLEMDAARKANEDIAEQREESGTDERREDDWRDPATLDLDDMIGDSPSP